MKLKQITVGKTQLNVKVASTKAQRKRGLMFCDHLPKDQGMLFVYPQKKILYFWMKNTTIPLSIAFIDDNFKIIEIKYGQPNDSSSISSEGLAKFALEVNKGWFHDNNIKVGDKIKLNSNKNVKINIVK